MTDFSRPSASKSTGAPRTPSQPALSPWQELGYSTPLQRTVFRNTLKGVPLRLSNGDLHQGRIMDVGM